MKTKIFLSFLLMFGFSVRVNAATAIPAPIFYKISKQLLKETQSFVEAGEVKTAKPKQIKIKGTSGNLKCQPKREQEIKNLDVLGLESKRNLWKIDVDDKIE